jgi:hypothetical protein
MNLERLRSKSIAQPGRGQITTARMNTNFRIPTKVRLQVSLPDIELRIVMLEFGQREDRVIHPFGLHRFMSFSVLLAGSR